MQLDDFGVPQLKVVLCFINLFLILAVLAVVWRSNDGLASPKWCSERRSVVAGHGQDVLRWVRPVAFGRGQSLTQKKPRISQHDPKTIQKPSNLKPYHRVGYRRPSHVNTFAFAEDLSFWGVWNQESGGTGWHEHRLLGSP